MSELNQVRIAILRRLAAEPPTRWRNGRWGVDTGAEGLTRHTLVGSVGRRVDREGRNRIDPGAQKYSACGT